MKNLELNPEFLETRRTRKKKLSATEELTLKIIYNFQINDKIFFGSDNWLAERRNLSEKSIQNHLKSLEKKGFIDRCEKYDGKRRIICLKPTENFFNYFQKKSTGTSGNFLPEVPEENFRHNTKGNSRGNPQSKPVFEQIKNLDSRYNKNVI